LKKERKDAIKIHYFYLLHLLLSSSNFQSSHKKRQPKKRIQILFAIHLFFGLFCVSVRLEERKRKSEIVYRWLSFILAKEFPKNSEDLPAITNDFLFHLLPPSNTK